MKTALKRSFRVLVLLYTDKDGGMMQYMRSITQHLKINFTMDCRK